MVPIWVQTSLNRAKLGQRVVLNNQYCTRAQKNDWNRHKATLPPRDDDTKSKSPNKPPSSSRSIKHQVNKTTTFKETLSPQPFQETLPPHAFKTQPLPLERTKANAPSNWQTKITASSKGKHTIQMTESPTILSTSMAASLIAQQTVDTPVPGKQRAATRVSHQNIHHRFYLNTDADKGSNFGLETQDLLDVVNSIDVLRRGDKGNLFACNMRTLTTQDYGNQYDWTPAQTETQLVDPEGHLVSKEIALLHQQVLNGIRNGKAFVGQVRPGMKSDWQQEEPATLEQCATQTLLNHQYAYLRQQQEEPNAETACAHCAYSPSEQTADDSIDHRIPAVFAVGRGHKQGPSSHMGEVCISSCGCGQGPLANALWFQVVSLPEEKPTAPKQNPQRPSLTSLIQNKSTPVKRKLDTNTPKGPSGKQPRTTKEGQTHSKTTKPSPTEPIQQTANSTHIPKPRACKSASQEMDPMDTPNQDGSPTPPVEQNSPLLLQEDEQDEQAQDMHGDSDSEVLIMLDEAEQDEQDSK
jgi:hypothetical protein